MGSVDLRNVVKDPDLRKSLEIVIDEIENLEDNKARNQEMISDLEDENLKLKDQVEMMQSKIAELEEALAEAYLTSESEDGISGEDVVLPSGRRTDVSDSAGD